MRIITLRAIKFKNKRAKRKHEERFHRKKNSKRLLVSKSYYKFESDYCTLIHREPQISKRKIIKGSYIKLADRPISKFSVQIKPFKKKLTKM